MLLPYETEYIKLPGGLYVINAALISRREQWFCVVSTRANRHRLTVYI